MYIPVSADRRTTSSVHRSPAGDHQHRVARLRGAGAVRARSVLARARVRRLRGGAEVVRRGLRPEPIVLVRLRRARPADRRLEEPAREQARRRGARLVQPGRPGRHQAHRGLHRGPAQRLQRGRHQGAAGQGVPAGQGLRARAGRVPRGQGVQPRSRPRLRARLPRGQGVRPVLVPHVPVVPLRRPAKLFIHIQTHTGYS